MVVTIKLLNNNKLSGIMKNKYCIEKVLDENRGGLRCRNFAKKEFWKIEHIKLFLVKHNSIFGVGYYSRKNKFFLLLKFYL